MNTLIRLDRAGGGQVAMASDSGCMEGGGPASSLVQTVQSRAPEVCGEQWAELISLNPSCFASRSIVRRASEARKLERFTIGRSKASQLYLSDRLISQIHCWQNSKSTTTLQGDFPW